MLVACTYKVFIFVTFSMKCCGILTTDIVLLSEVDFELILPGTAEVREPLKDGTTTMGALRVALTIACKSEGYSTIIILFKISVGSSN